MCTAVIDSTSMAAQPGPMNRPPDFHPSRPFHPFHSGDVDPFAWGSNSAAVFTPETCVAGLPHLLGFWPENSLIVMALREEASHPVVATLRIDLPDCEDPHDRADLVQGLHLPLAPASQLCDFMVIVVWSDTPLSEFSRCEVAGRGCGDREEGDLRSRGVFALIDEVVEMTQHLGVLVADALIVHRDHAVFPASRWKSTMCWDPQCCDPGGNLVSPEHQRIARQIFSRNNHAPATSRSVLEGELAGEAVPGAWPVESTVVIDTAFDTAVIHSVFTLCDQSTPRLEDAVLLTRALSNRTVRDAVLCEVLRLPQAAWSNAATVLAELVRICPPEYRAPLATLLGILRWQLGDGVRAAIAIEHALAADAQYSLARLIGDCLASGIHPGRWRQDLAGLNPRPH